MHREARADVLKTWLYATASVALGAWISPLIYNMGKALAEVSPGKQINGPLQWLAGLCRAAEFPRYFEVGLLLGAAVLFLPFIHTLRGGRSPEDGGQWLQKNPQALRQAVTGFLLVALLFLALAGVLAGAGVLAWKPPGEARTTLVLRAFIGALGLAALQEIVFRGIAQGIFLRAARPWLATGLSALLFALVHFLIPPTGMNVADPDAAGTGFELLHKILAQLGQPQALLGVFLPMLALGVVLANARLRTASLWLPIGLHAGWIFVQALLERATVSAAHADSTLSLLSGASLDRGVVPLVGFIVAGVLMQFLTTQDDDALRRPA